MKALKIFLRISRVLGKVILGLLLVVLIIVALIHLPPVQKQITRKLSTYLTSKIEARVDIKRINFSILGNVAIDTIAIWDPAANKIFSADKIEVSSSIYNLVTGDFIFDQVGISGADVKLIQHEEGLNIQFILDAFKPKEKKTTTKSNPVILQFKTVLLENILFEFISTKSGVTVGTNLGMLTIQDGEFSTHPVKIKADQVILEHSVVNTLTTSHPDILHPAIASKGKKLLSPDFGTGIIFEIKDLQFKDNNFSMHRDQVIETKKFDPTHLSFTHIQLSLTNILIHKDTLAAGLQSLAVQLPGFALTDGQLAIQANREHFTISGIHFASGINELHARLKAPLDFNSIKNEDHSPVEIEVQSKIKPSDFAYFFSDSFMNPLNRWEFASLDFNGNYILKKGEIHALNLKTGNSQLHAEGMVQDVLDAEKISWKEVVVNASVGSDFQSLLKPFLRKINVPPHLTIQLKSSGNPDKIYADSKVLSGWGDAKLTGMATRQLNNMNIDINLTGEKVDLGAWMNLASIGAMDLSVDAKGTIGVDQQIEINGLITDIELLKQPIHDIAFKSTTRKDSATVAISIEDPNYRTEIISEILFRGPLTVSSNIQLDSFKLGRLLHLDSTLYVSGDTKSKIIIDSTSIEGTVAGNRMLFHKQSVAFSLDTMDIHALLSPAKSDFEYYTDFAKIKLSSDFDIRHAAEIIQAWSENRFKTSDTVITHTGTRTAKVTIELENASFLKLVGVDVDEFSTLRLAGGFDEEKQTITLNATSGKYKGYGISLDTLFTDITVLPDSIGASLNVRNLLYNSIQLGDLDFYTLTNGDTAISNLLLTSDSSTLLGFQVRILPIDSGAYVYPDKLRAFDNDYYIDSKNPVYIGKNNLAFNHFKFNRDEMQISLDGDLNYFDVSLKNVDLTPLNFLLSPDTTIINKGHLTGDFSYSRDKHLKLKADIDSLSLYNSSPLTITATAESEGNQVPFEFLLTNTTNMINLKGNYFSEISEVDAALALDINNTELFEFLIAGFIDDIHGAIKGEATINGPIKKPAVKGSIRFLDLELTTANPRLTFNIEDDRITLDNSSLLFNKFTLYDKDRHPLTIDGNITSKDDRSIAYDLQIKSTEYSLINNPDSTSGKLRGVLVMDSDIKLKGDGKDRNIDAGITIKNATDLTVVTSSKDIELLKTEGIIDFIDPTLFLDSAFVEQATDFYDSLLASLPDFNLNSTVKIEDNATFRVLIDEQSGDYIEATGSADLELGYDRTGNLSLSGNYTIQKGVYRLSFYDLVKKNFTLVQGSSINWHGSPKNGDLSIKAAHTVESNSLGLIGHEIGENEKSIYKRSLDYEVGINIMGTIEKPIISFSLDLPPNEKVSYPVLANKLDRLRQPEYASELNKQVFGLLVLGGFLPESSADVNSNVIATTALANSVNSLLASQLNRFANQYVKGVNIDVGIQSYSDYSAPGGKTQTAMDFRVSKRMMNDRLSFEIGGDFDINQDQSGANTGTKNYRGDIAIIYDLTGNGDKQLKLFNNETYDIIYQEIRNTGVSLIFIREFASKEENKKEKKNK